MYIESSVTNYMQRRIVRGRNWVKIKKEESIILKGKERWRYYNIKSIVIEKPVKNIDKTS